MRINYLDPTIWGPHYWFFLNTIAMTYPKYPNAVTKKKYYELIQNFSLFIPNEEIATSFEKLINTYPIMPYLDNQKSIIKWIHFIHNKINEKLEKPTISLNEFYSKYYNEYKTKDAKMIEFNRMKKQFVYFIILLLIGGLIYYLYDK